MNSKDPIVMNLTIKRTYNWLWIKYATGFRSNTHCMNCLVGGRSESIPPRRKAETKHPYAPGTVYNAVLNEYSYKYVYLCGVTDNWADNLHVVVRHKHGSVVQHEDAFCKVVMTNCERVPIPGIEAGSIDRGMQFTTCRNFQFGYYYLRDTDPYDGKSAAELGLITANKKANKSSFYKQRTLEFKPGEERVRFVRRLKRT